MPRKRNNAHEAEIVLVTGSSGAGKTTWMKKIIKRRKRVIIYDAAKHEYGDVADLVIVADPPDKKGAESAEKKLLKAIRQNLDSQIKIAFQPLRPTAENFDFWCRVVYAWGDCTAVAEELADVTTPGKAPTGWGDVLRKGRAYGLKVYGLTQRPAESDKTIIGNATLIHAGRQARFEDMKYMAREMSLTADDFKMQPGQWIEYDLQKLTHKRGKS